MLVYRNASGYVLTGPQYLTVLNGQTGAEVVTVNFDVPRATVSAWGDTYGNRVDRFLGAAAYLDGTGLPSFIMARGYYTRTTLTAWNWRSGQLTQPWKFDGNVTPADAAGRSYSGQGSHTASGVSSNNGTKSTPTLTADLYGDWREEVVWRETDNAALRLYTTTAVTTRRIYTLMHDPQYRVHIALQNGAYDQPPHPSFHIGSGVAAPPVPNIAVK